MRRGDAKQCADPCAPTAQKDPAMPEPDTPMLDMPADRIMREARRLGIRPSVLLDRILRGVHQITCANT